MSASVFRHAHRVTYAECTLGNHVYYARYLDMLETARGEFFRQLGAPCMELQQQGALFPVVECRIRYKSPARYDDELMIEVRLTAAGGARLNFAYHIVNQTNTLVLEAETFHVCTGPNEKPKRLPEDLLTKLLPHLPAQAPQSPRTTQDKKMPELGVAQSGKD